MGEEGAVWHSHVGPARHSMVPIWAVLSPVGLCCQGSSWGKQGTAAALGSESFLLWTFRAERIHLGLTGSITLRIVWVRTFSLCLCRVVAVFGGMWGHSSFPFPAAAPFVEAIKEAPF